MESKNAIRNNEIADPILYRLYFSIMASDVLHKLGLDATAENKAKLHEYHKQVLGYKTIAGQSHHIVSMFLLETTIHWAERGIFVRTRADQPLDIEQRPLHDVWQYL